MGALQPGQRDRYGPARREHAGTVESAYRERMRRPIRCADDDHLRFARLNGARGKAEGDAECGAGGDRREREAGDSAEDRNLRRRRVVDIPDHVGGDVPGRFGGVPLFAQFCVALFFFPDQVKFGGFHIAVMDAQTVDFGELGEIFLKSGERAIQ